MKQDSKDKKKKLAGLKMPAKPDLDTSELESADEDQAPDMGSSDQDSDAGLEGSEEDMGMDIDGDHEAGEPEDHKMLAELEQCSDEDLIAELKKRGLMSKLMPESGEPGEEDQDMGNGMPTAPHQDMGDDEDANNNY